MAWIISKYSGSSGGVRNKSVTFRISGEKTKFHPRFYSIEEAMINLPSCCCGNPQPCRDAGMDAERCCEEELGTWG